MGNLVVLDGTVDSINEPRTTTGGKPVTDFRINDGKGWFTVVCWEDLASQIPPVGAYVVVSGRLQTRSYEAANNGGKRYVTEVVAATLTVVGQSAAPTKPAGDDDLFGS